MKGWRSSRNERYKRRHFNVNHGRQTNSTGPEKYYHVLNWRHRFKVIFWTIQIKYRPKTSCKLWDSLTVILLHILCFRNSEIYIKYYMNIFQTMMLGVIPFCALIFFNIKIYNRFMLTRGRFQRRNTGSTQVSLNLK